LEQKTRRARENQPPLGERDTISKKEVRRPFADITGKGGRVWNKRVDPERRTSVNGAGRKREIKLGGGMAASH